MNLIKTKIALIDYFRKNKKDLILPYKEIKKDIQNSSEYDLNQNYLVHIQELNFYGKI